MLCSQRLLNEHSATFLAVTTGEPILEPLRQLCGVGHLFEPRGKGLAAGACAASALGGGWGNVARGRCCRHVKQSQFRKKGESQRRAPVHPDKPAPSQ